MSEDVLERVYQENLEERIIARIAQITGLSLLDAMDVYYRSRLSEEIYAGTEGVQYLDYKVLVDILRETEPNLFA